MLADVFHAWWFTTLLGFVSFSIIFVSIAFRVRGAYARPYRKTDLHFRAALPNPGAANSECLAGPGALPSGL